MHNGASKTKIVYQANLNFKTVNPYLDLLIKNEMIQVNEGRAILYETTPTGVYKMLTHLSLGILLFCRV